MAIPTNATAWTQPMDPTDLVEYIADFAGGDSPVLEASETISSYTVALSAEAVAVGVTISTDVGYEVSLINASTAIKVWFYVEAAFRENAAFDGEGLQVGVTFTINTSSTPARRRQRTFILQVAQQ